MTLDILDGLNLTEDDLSLAALSFARDAQEKKDALTRKLATDKEAAYYDLLERGMLRSSMLQDVYDQLQNDYDTDVQILEDDLFFQIQFLGGSSGTGDGEYADGDDAGGTEYSYPYNPDYSLDYAGRYYAVYNYYMTMTDAKVRFALFQADTLAPSYLGEFYATLYARLKSYAEYE